MVNFLIKFKHKIARAINIILIYCYRILPVNSNLIVFESEGDLSDNSYALYDYLRENGFLKKYYVVWLVEDLEKARIQVYENTDFVEKLPQSINARRSKYLATCRWYIYDHGNLIDNVKKRHGQETIFLSHGCTFKMPSKDAKDCTADEVYITGKLYKYSMSVFCQCNENVLLDIGYPRLDYFFNRESLEEAKIRNHFQLQKYKKLLLWMPTFRKSVSPHLNESYFDNATGLPIIENQSELLEFNDFLKKYQAVCVFKVHHLQAELESFHDEYSNIIIISDSILRELNVQLYQFVPVSDALITDYSSIGSDYMLLDKPIVYTLDDYENYRTSRGFSVEDPAQWFVGYHVYKKQDLYDAIKEIIDGKDVYKEKRKEALPLMHTYCDGNASSRIVKHLGLHK